MAHVRATIGGDTSDYRRSLRGMEGMTQSSAARLTRIFASIGLGAMAVRWGRGVTQWSSEASIAARNAQVLTEQMIALNRIGIQSGMRGAGDFARMITRISDELTRAVRGSEESARKFEQMGLSIDDLIRMDPAAQLEAIARAAFDSGLPLANLSDLFGQRLGPTAMVALRSIAENGLPAVEAEMGNVADAAEELGSKWAETMDKMRAKTAQWANSLHNIISDAGAFWGGVFGGSGDMAARLRNGFRQMAQEEEAREAQAQERRERRVHEQRRVIEEMIQLRGMSGDGAMAGTRERGPMTSGGGVGTDALRRIGGMTGSGASEAARGLRLDQDRNAILSRIEAQLAREGRSSASLEMR